MASPREPSQTWENPPSIYRGAPFWSWNAKLEPDRLCDAIKSMHAAGMGGFFMHSRYGLKTPYLSEEWFRCISACIEKARELGMKAYLYDEDRWPSGAAGGLVTRDNVEYRMHYLLAHETLGQQQDAERLAVFSITQDKAGRCASYQTVEDVGQAGRAGAGKVLAFDVCVLATVGWHNDGAYLDTMNAQAVDEFINVTHQAYADRYGEDFGGLIPAIFTDEPNYLHLFRAVKDTVEGERFLPWTPDLPREFISRRGYDLREKLPELVCQMTTGAFSKVRHDYYRTVTELFVENFSQRIGRWCNKHQIALTGHVLDEPTLRSQIGVVGAAMPHYQHMQWPGIDILCDEAEELSTAKQCSSVAAQLGKQRVLSELYGCTGWDWPLAGHKFIGDWQLACGVNFRCPHLTHYSLAGGAKRDYPASIFSHSPWWKYYRAVEDYFARLCAMLTCGRPVRDVLVIHPIESAWGLFRRGAPEQDPEMIQLDESFKQVIYALSGGHYDWDFGDESLLAIHGKVGRAALKVGQMTYRLVVVPPCLTLRSTTVSMLSKFQAGGGKVLFVGRQPNMIDAEPDDQIGRLTAQAASCGLNPHELLRVIESLLPRRVSIRHDGAEADFVWYMLRSIDEGQLLFVQSHRRAEARKVHLTVRGSGPAVLWDPRTGERTKMEWTTSAGGVAFDLDLDPAGSALVSLGLAIPDAHQVAPAPAVGEARPIVGPYRIELTEPNTLPLDYCRFSIGAEELSELIPTLEADRRIRQRFGLSTRIGYEHQPWYLYATGAVDVSPRGGCRLSRTFHVTDVPRRCQLALERPEDYKITVNGRTVGKVSGWWVDQDIKTIDIASALKAGPNEVVLAFNYRPDMELEDVYLVGDFGVMKLSDGPREPGNFTLVALPRQLVVGSWVDQGLDFYGGAVLYHLKLDRPASVGRASGSAGRVRVALPGVACTAAAIHVGGKTIFLPWPPFVADISDALSAGADEVIVEVIGGRKNILGPLHTPWERWTGPRQFDPQNEKWTRDYLLTDHGLTAAPVLEILA